jgi:hypothetical protein
MIVQVLASDREQADARLEKEGGFVSKREVIFKDMVSLYSGLDSSELKERGQ